MRITSLATLSAALLITSPAAATIKEQAETASPQAAQVAEAKTPDSGKKICRRLVVSGTRMADRVCLTKDEWKKVEEEK
jgi:hypothetical protein